MNPNIYESIEQNFMIKIHVMPLGNIPNDTFDMFYNEIKKNNILMFENIPNLFSGGSCI